MKTINFTRGFFVAALFLSASLSSAQAPIFRNVVSRVCDGTPQAPQAGERVAFIQTQALIGLSQPSTDGCLLVNFHTFVATSFGNENGKKTAQVQIVPGRTLQKSSCTSELKEVPEQFAAAEINGNKMTLFGGTPCKKLELVLK